LEIPVIEARSLVKRYRSTLAVDELSFDVRPGTVTGFLGPNGAGKTNLGQRHFFLRPPCHSTPARSDGRLGGAACPGLTGLTAAR
jgi:ABC-2 type transport system ATP-binding protein